MSSSSHATFCLVLQVLFCGRTDSAAGRGCSNCKHHGDVKLLCRWSDEASAMIPLQQARRTDLRKISRDSSAYYTTCRILNSRAIRTTVVLYYLQYSYYCVYVQWFLKELLSGPVL